MTDSNILYVEDEEMYQTLVKDVLGEEGFAVHTAGTGSQACQMLGQLRPDLMILDINLPDADGYDLCRRFRQEDLWSQLPILMFTVRRHPEEWRQGFLAGATDYVSKPLHGPDLIERVRSCLGGKRSADCTNAEVLMIQAALAGNRGAYDVFVRQYRNQLQEHILGHARNITEAEDVVSAAFLRAYENLSQFRGQSSFYTWLFRIAIHELYRKWRHPTVPLDRLGEIAQAEIDESQHPSTAEMSQAGKVELLDQAIVQVPEPYRKLLKWHFVQQLPYTEIARRLALPIGTVKTRLFKAQALLREAWQSLHDRYHH